MRAQTHFTNPQAIGAVFIFGRLYFAALAAYAQDVPKDRLRGAQIIILLCDEIFTLGQPTLISVEPRSLAIVKIELVENREAETWKKYWEELAQAGLIKQPRVVSDQGPGLMKVGDLIEASAQAKRRLNS